jgi:putative NIF3 family GTP cyclohydrolase 1 type 2
MDEMLDDGVECLITGEVEHEAWNAIMEAGVPVVAMGHYRSETTGVLALKEEIENRFSLPCEFIDLPSGL